MATLMIKDLELKGKEASPFFLRCPDARTIASYNPLTRQITVKETLCKRYTCPHCIRSRVAKIRSKSLRGNPTHFITLTTRPLTDESPKQAHDRVRPHIARLYQQLRRYTEHFEAATFLELHRSGYPHWHALARTTFIPQHTLSQYWYDLTGFPIVDIRRIKSEHTAAVYVTKYTTKSINQQVHRRLGRLVTYTRHYLLREEPNPAQPTQRYKYFNIHPTNFLLELPNHLAINTNGPNVTIYVPSWDTPPPWINPTTTNQQTT